MRDLVRRVCRRRRAKQMRMNHPATRHVADLSGRIEMVDLAGWMLVSCSCGWQQQARLAEVEQAHRFHCAKEKVLSFDDELKQAALDEARFRRQHGPGSPGPLHRLLPGSGLEILDLDVLRAIERVVGHPVRKRGSAEGARANIACGRAELRRFGFRATLEEEDGNPSGR